LSYLDQIDRLRKRLKESLPGVAAQEKMAARVIPMPDEIPSNVRSSAVMVLLFPKQDVLNLLLIVRTIDGRAHSGQVAFPGGRMEPTDKDLAATALRETWEEIGISADKIDVLGALTSLYIPISNFNVFPFVGFLKDAAEAYELSKNEVASVWEVSLTDLFAPANKITTDIIPSSRPDMVLQHVPAYSLPDKPIIWGATAMMLSELEVCWLTR
jgi:8-oxo-dGTP pyrophosphatase MutT (NUDIX family)